MKNYPRCEAEQYHLADNSRPAISSDHLLLLHRGQVGTVVMTYEGEVFDVEFAGHDGRVYAILPLRASKLLILRYTPDYAPA